MKSADCSQELLRCDWIKSKHGRTAWKVHYQSHLVPCEFFSVGLHNVIRISDKMQVVYKEMTCDGPKSAVAKWNFVGGIPFKHMKNYPLCMYSNDLVCSDGTLEVVFMVHDGM